MADTAPSGPYIIFTCPQDNCPNEDKTLHYTAGSFDDALVRIQKLCKNCHARELVRLARERAEEQARRARAQTRRAGSLARRNRARAPTRPPSSAEQDSLTPTSQASAAGSPYAPGEPSPTTNDGNTEQAHELKAE